MRVLVLISLALCASAQAVEPWQKVLVLGNEATDIGQLLKNCEFKATVVASGRVDKLTQRLAEEALSAGGNVVHVLGATNVASEFALRQQGTVNGRAFYCDMTNVGAKEDA